MADGLGPLYKQGLTLISAWLSNYMPSKLWDEIAYWFPNFNSATIEVWEWIGLSHILWWVSLLIHAVIKLIHISKRGPWF